MEIPKTNFIKERFPPNILTGVCTLMFVLYNHYSGSPAAICKTDKLFEQARGIITKAVYAAGAIMPDLLPNKRKIYSWAFAASDHFKQCKLNLFKKDI